MSHSSKSGIRDPGLGAGDLKSWLRNATKLEPVCSNMTNPIKKSLKGGLDKYFCGVFWPFRSLYLDHGSLEIRLENPPLVENLILNKGGVFGSRANLTRFWRFLDPKMTVSPLEIDILGIPNPQFFSACGGPFPPYKSWHFGIPKTPRSQNLRPLLTRGGVRI